MEPEDVSDTGYWERFSHYMDQYGLNSLARDTAVAEMLDEIHVMLRELLKSRAT